MSDVAVAADAAPASAPAPAPAPAPQQVPVDTSPVHIPSPVGSQTPPSNRPLPSVTDSLAKAFERANKPVNAERPKPEQRRQEPRERPGMGHNNPPEPMQAERRQERRERRQQEREQQPQPFDLKKRPSETLQLPQQRARGEHGHFAPREAQPPRLQGEPGQSQESGRAPTNVIPLPPTARFREPPRGMNQQAQRDWHATPESVRQNVHYLHHLAGQHYRAANADRAEMNSIRHFQQMARQHGTTLAQALTNYTGIEDKLRTDPIGGLDMIVNNLNLRSADGQKIGLRDVAWYILNQTPDQHRAIQSQNMQTSMAYQMAALRQQQQMLAQQQADMRYQQEFGKMRYGVDRFAESHPRFDELGDLIQRELGFGFDLPTAYRRAELLRPSPTGANGQANGNPGNGRDRASAAAGGTRNQNSNSDRSISGAPDSRLNGSPRQRPSGSAHEAITRAFRRAGVAV